ncbi:hypothetical protein ACJW31_08G000600 [Castanea mollissima]
MLLAGCRQDLEAVLASHACIASALLLWTARACSWPRMQNIMWVWGLWPPLPTYQASVIALPRTIAALVRALPRPRASLGLRATPASTRNATWLILPVVICLSQRLSHACVSMN